MEKEKRSQSGIPREYLEVCFDADAPEGGWPQRFGVVTAYNSEGKVREEAENRKADARLQRRLEEEGLLHFRVTGRNREGTHREPGFGIATADQEKIRFLSREFRQLGFYWIENGIVHCGMTRENAMERIGPWNQRFF